ncbi:MAG: nucleotidyltransferase domain-containing protein [Deltaproteobacteria bacterium]|nr:nucleotidyltransferase domain-containing protein [Deltaproteobacteria bacterium]
MRFGLKEETIEKVNRVFNRYDAIDTVILYGSRAKGSHKPGSDIDLTLIGKKLNLKLLNKISLDLDDLLLPYTIDLSIYHNINDADLIEHIERVKKIFYRSGVAS